MSVRGFAAICLAPIIGLMSTSIAHSEEGGASFAPCDDRGLAPVLATSECARISAPLYHDRAGEDRTLELFVRRFPASGASQGEVWFIAGGPGESGASYYPAVDFFREVFPNYDLIMPDHRGTGYSAKLCEPEETPDSDEGLVLAGSEWGSCFGQLYGDMERTHAFNSRQAALDLDLLTREIGGGGERFFYGVSYGTGLVLQYAALTETPPNGLILDSLVAHPDHRSADLSYRSEITHQVGTDVLMACSEASTCPLGNDAVARYGALLARIDAGESLSGLEAVPGGDLRQLLGTFLDIPAARNRIPTIIAALEANAPEAAAEIQAAITDTQAFLAPLAVTPQATSSIPLVALMAGSEFNGRRELTAQTVAQERADYLFTSPLASLLADTQFPLYERPQTAESAGLPPVLLIQGTLDPKTPYDAALARAQSWRESGAVSVLSLSNTPHAAYLTSQSCLAAPLRAFTDNPVREANSSCAPQAVELRF
ncbi:MAG: alpha/beta fold hydrolase [Alphaproteobacteria bacterium]|nr:alpha/beta fold hydrolase [Alphaproteobacteria bacterium]